MGESFLRKPGSAMAPTLGPTVDTSKLTLPTRKSEPRKNLSDFLLFIYGEKKIGKTSLASTFPAALHLFFEPGGKGLSTFDLEISHWSEFVKVIDLLNTEQGDAFQNVVIDTADIAYTRCFEFVCKRELMTHPSDNNDFGKSWNLIKTEYSNQMNRLAKTGKGIVILSHASESEIRTRNFGTYTKIVPTLPKQALEFLTGAADLNGYYGFFGSQRFLAISGTDGIEAGNRMKHNFWSKQTEEVINEDTGDTNTRKIKVAAIPMGKSEEESYSNLVRAFDNRQEDPYLEILEEGPTIQDRNAVLRAKGKGG